jgi:hypothetical protein
MPKKGMTEKWGIKKGGKKDSQPATTQALPSNPAPPVSTTHFISFLVLINPL